MRRIHFLTFFFLLAFAASGFSSQINKITLAELHATADLIVMAEVIKVVEEQHVDHVTIRTNLFLKGAGSRPIYTFTLIPRGGLKDFDPSLKKGDTGVFFLKKKNQEGHVEKAYWGSVAIFQKNNFQVTDLTNLSESLNTWRLHRDKLGQITNVEEYKRGFQNGFIGPPGLVDGSADFNLGHSDGMSAKIKMFPKQQQTGESN